MKTTDSRSLQAKLQTFRTNPGKIQQFMLEVLERLNDGELRVIDATNPAVFCLETSAVLAATNMIDSETKLRKQYPSLAVTQEELYLHMSDIDYLGIFSNPARVNLSIIMDLDEVLQKAVNDTTGFGVKKLTIPRYTKVYVAGVELTLLYPIDIRVMPHGGLNITFDNSEPTPIAHIENNLLDWYADLVDGVRYLKIVAPFHQLNINRYNVSLNAASGFVKEYTYDDYFYYVRAYIQDGSKWKEIRVTHNDLVYNQELPTVVVKILDNKIKVNIPQIYFDNGKITDTVRLDIYTTKGELDINLNNYNLKSYSHNFAPLDNTEQTIYSAPFNTFSQLGFLSDDIISGGSGPISFEKLKYNVTTRNAFTERLPISEKQLERNFNQMGYSITKTIDNITDRQYLATRSLPIPENKFIVTNLPMNVSTLETSFTKLKELDTVTSGARRLTIKSGTLFELKDGILSLIDNNTANTMRMRETTNPGYVVNWLNRNTILYNPYYYVFDISRTDTVPRIYDLDNPKIRSRFFYQDNATLAVTFGVEDYIIANSPNKDGYILELKMQIGETIKELGQDYVDVQLSYKGRNSNNRHYIKGRLVSEIDSVTKKPVDDIYIYQFKIETRYDIDAQDGIIPIPYKNPIDLTHEFDIVTIICDYNPGNAVEKSDIDDLINKPMIPNYNSTSVYHGVSHNKIVIEFGKRLKHLWHRTRTVVDIGERDYWEVDVPAVYDEDQYKLDSNGNIAISFDVHNNNVTTTLLHRKGDLIYDDTGEQVFAHRKGDPKLDRLGNPVYKNNGDGLIRQIDLFLLDAMFYFGNTDDVKTYTNHCSRLITQWVTTDMVQIHNQLLDRTELFYHPPVSLGMVKATVDNSIEVTLESKQSIKVTAYLSELNMQNASLRESLYKTIIETVQKTLLRKTVSVDIITQQLRIQTGDIVISYVIDGFLGNRYNTATLSDSTKTLTLGKRAIVLPNMLIDIRDDINVEFKVHIE